MLDDRLARTRAELRALTPSDQWARLDRFFDEATFSPGILVSEPTAKLPERFAWIMVDDDDPKFGPLLKARGALDANDFDRRFSLTQPHSFNAIAYPNAPLALVGMRVGVSLDSHDGPLAASSHFLFDPTQVGQAVRALGIPGTHTLLIGEQVARKEGARQLASAYELLSWSGSARPSLGAGGGNRAGDCAH